jgi:gliding motility-associated-like protein
MLHAVFLMSLFSVTICKSQTVSNEGTEFYAVFPVHVPSRNVNGTGARLADYSIFITSKNASSGTVSAGTFSQAFNVTPNTVTEIRIPREEAYLDSQESHQVLTGKAIRVVVDPGRPKVVVYGHIFAGARSAASLILPKQALGERYFSMNYPSAGEGVNFIVMVGTEPDTRIFLRKNGQDLIQGGITLDEGEVYQYISVEDLTGTEVVADSISSPCKSFAVFTGSSNSVINLGACLGSSLDPLYQQSYPIGSWGSTFGYIPFTNSSTGNYLRVVAGQDGTEVRIRGNLIANLNAGQFYETPEPLTAAGMISSSKPVLVAQFSVSQQCSGLIYSDPDMVLLNPVEYNIRDITVYSSSREVIVNKYLNILIKTSAAGTFRLNGQVPGGSFSALPDAPEYSFIQLNLDGYAQDNFRLTASEGFNAIAYGFGVFESYAYSAGTSLAASQSLVAVRKATREELPNACTREEFDFRLTLADTVTQIVWNFENAPAVIQNENELDPVPFVRNGKTLYSYFYPRTHVFDSPGEKVIRATVTYPTANVCHISQEVIEFSFEVYDPPSTAFSSTGPNCVNTPVQFTDESTGAFKDISKWNWDFGDGQISQEQHPKHVFLAPGTYQVKLFASNEAGCPGDVLMHEVTIQGTPGASFAFSPPTCADNRVTFTSEKSEGVLSRTWDFGDGTPAHQMTTDGSVIHDYVKPGAYAVSLTVISTGGCQAIYSDTVNVFAPLLEAGKDQLILEGGQVRLNIETSGNGLTYRWTPATGLDRDDVPNPVASPVETTDYTITVTTTEGCIITDRLTIGVVKNFIVHNTFTPNGDGINDVWAIDNLDTNPNAHVNVFNRYGEKLFTSIGYSSPWDGRFRGAELPVGTYFYVIDPRNGQPVKTGSVTILR